MMEIQFKILLLFFLVFLNSVVTQQLSPAISNSEWQALLSLRSYLGITAKDWHKKASPCLNWTGIECKNGHVTVINLSGLRRTQEGKINPQFAVDSLPNFALLSAFNSSGFLLPGSIPEWFGLKLNNLEVLDLRSSSIYGSIPSSVGSLSKLHSLYLSNNSITSIIPAALGKLVSLSVLDLSQNLLTGPIPNEISELKNLISLDLSSNFLSGGIPLGLGSLSSLKSLNLSNNSLSASIPAQLGNLSQLISLDLGYNSLLGSLPKELGGLRNVRKMMIGNNGLEGSLFDDLFRNITHLEYLSLCRNSFDGRLPDAIWSMPHLRYIDVSDNNFTGVFPRVVASFNVKGGVFNFSNNMFFGTFISRNGKLSTIDLSSNYFQGTAPNDTGSNIILINNCFSSVPGQRNSWACKNFYSERGLIFGNDRVGKPMQQPMMDTPKRNNRTIYIKVGLFGALGFVIVLIAGLLLLLKRFKFGRTNHQRGENVRPVLEGLREKTPIVSIDYSGIGESFAYEQILQATCNFSNEKLIKHGHSGDLFQGTLESGHPVVIKRVDLHSFGKESFMSELNLFGKVTHPRLIPLVGHCLEDENVKFLVYKHMPNGDLSNSLYKLTDMEEDPQSLDWITRLKIATGAAEVLCYLHSECIPPLVHRDIQASSILLDDKYEVRLGSLSEVCAQGTDNSQNVIARMILTTQNSGKRLSGSSSITCAYDVYCFGKVLLELITGGIGISNLNDADAKQWLESNLPFISIHEKELVIKIVDQSLIIDEDLLEEVWAVAIVAKSCLNPKASKRPSMRHVLKALENPFKVVREENFSSARLRTVSSTWSWTAAFFGSWRHSSSGSSNISGQREIIGGLRQSERIGSRGSGANEHSTSLKRSSSDVFPEPVEMQDVERQDESSWEICTETCIGLVHFHLTSLEALYKKSLHLFTTFLNF